MLCLLGYVCPVGRQEKAVAATPELVRIVILQRQLGLQRGFEIGIHAKIVAIEFPYFRKTVFVVIEPLSLLGTAVKTCSVSSFTR